MGLGREGSNQSERSLGPARTYHSYFLGLVCTRTNRAGLFDMFVHYWSQRSCSLLHWPMTWFSLSFLPLISGSFQPVIEFFNCCVHRSCYEGFALVSSSTLRKRVTLRTRSLVSQSHWDLHAGYLNIRRTEEGKHKTFYLTAKLHQGPRLFNSYVYTRMQHLCCLVSSPPLSTAWSIRSRPFPASNTPHCLS